MRVPGRCTPGARPSGAASTRSTVSSPAASARARSGESATGRARAVSSQASSASHRAFPAGQADHRRDQSHQALPRGARDCVVDPSGQARQRRMGAPRVIAPPFPGEQAGPLHEARTVLPAPMGARTEHWERVWDGAVHADTSSGETASVRRARGTGNRSTRPLRSGASSRAWRLDRPRDRAVAVVRGPQRPGQDRPRHVAVAALPGTLTSNVTVDIREPVATLGELLRVDLHRESSPAPRAGWSPCRRPRRRTRPAPPSASRPARGRLPRR